MHRQTESAAPLNETRHASRPPRDPRPRVLFITQLDVWHLTATKGGVKTGGNQSIYNTLIGYVAAGFDVHLLTTATSLADAELTIPGVTIHRVTLLGVRTFQRLRSLIKGRPNPAGCAPVSHAAASSVLKTGQSLRMWFAFQATMLFHVPRMQLKYGFDVFYGYEVFGAFAAYWIGRLRRATVVTRFQGTELSGLVDGQRARLWKRHWTHLIGMSRPADVIVMANDGTQGDRLLRYLRLPEDRTRFWINGIDKHRVLSARGDTDAVRRELGAVDGRLMIVTACRLIGWKRIDRALRALATVCEDADFVYAILGEGPMRGELEALAHEVGVADRVRFLGPRPHADVMAYMHACDIYLSTYDLSNLGNPILEAIVCERCIVTLNNGGTADVIEHNRNGMMLTPDDADGLANALRRVLTDAALRERLQRGAAETAARLKTWAERMEMETADVMRAMDRRTSRR